jgi:membrane protein
MRNTINTLLDAYQRFADDDGWAIASHIALTTLTSLFPFLIFITAVAGALGSSELADEAARLMLDAWPASVAGPISAEIRNVFSQPHRNVLTLGAALAVYFASSGVEALRICLNRAYNQKETRPWWLLRLESIAYVLGGAAALMALAFGVVLGPLIFDQAAAWFPALAAARGLFTAARLGVASLVLMINLVVIHKFLPAGRRSLVSVAPGIAFTFIFCIAAGEGYGLYLARFAGNYISTYAGLASVMIALVFLYTMAAIFVFGGELNAAIARTPHVAKG